MRIKGAIFDMDGLLLDTEAQSVQCWPMAGREMGYEITAEMVHAVTGSNHTSCRAMMEGFLGPGLDFERLYQRVGDLIFERMQQLKMPLRPYARQILHTLKEAGFRMAVATSTNRDRAELELREAGLMAFFATLAFGNEVEHGKPAPDIFLLAARRLDVAPEACAVLEDSPNGIRAAIDAGMEGLWIPDQITPSERPDTEKLATRVFPTLKEAARYLAGQG